MNPTGDLISRRQLFEELGISDSNERQEAQAGWPRMAPAPLHRQEGLLSARCHCGLAASSGSDLPTRRRHNHGGGAGRVRPGGGGRE